MFEILSSINWAFWGPIVATIGGALGIAAKIWPIIKRTKNKVKGIFTEFCLVPTQINEMWIKQQLISDRVTSIEKEFRANGGTSLKDAIKRIEDKMLKHDAYIKLRMHLEHSPSFECDLDGDVVWINRAYTEVFGLSISDIRGRKWLATIHYDDKEAVLLEYDRILEDKRSGELKFRVLIRNAYHDCIVRIWPMEKDDNEIIGWFGYSEVVD
jgi:PAS domain S-box-containing protein